MEFACCKFDSFLGGWGIVRIVENSDNLQGQCQHQFFLQMRIAALGTAFRPSQDGILPQNPSEIPQIAYPHSMFPVRGEFFRDGVDLRPRSVPSSSQAAKVSNPSKPRGGMNIEAMKTVAEIHAGISLLEKIHVSRPRRVAHDD